MKREETQSGFALVAMMMLMTAMVTLLGAYVILTRIELATTRYSRSFNRGFNTAEAGLNLRADEVRQIFVGFNVPTGTSPNSTGACSGSNQGSGNFACEQKALNNRNVTSYIQADPTNPVLTTIPVGERYQTLQAQEYKYTATAVSKDQSGRVESMLGLRFKSRLIPLFQFAAFYNKDLEILPGPAMTLAGPVHTNGDLYLNANTSLRITGQVTTAGNLYRGRKNDSTCMSTPTSVNVLGTSTYVNLIPSCPSRKLITTSNVAPYNGNVKFDVPDVTVPPPDSFDPTQGKVYWDGADLRVVLHLNASNNPVTTYAASGVEVRRSDDTVDTNRTTTLNSIALCPGSIGESPANANNGRAVGNSNTFYNFREAKYIRLLEVDLNALIDCIQNRNILDNGGGIGDTTGGGLVLFMTVDGPNETAAANSYGFRIRKGSSLKRGTQSNGLPLPQGVSLVSDQAAYVRGDFNSVNKIPAAIMADSLNLLSNNWNLANTASSTALSTRIASNTTMNMAFLAGTDTTGNQEGAAGQGGAYNGGLENFPRFHEDWSGKTLTYRGSFVSLGRARHVSGSWGAQSYSPPNRDWNYDTSFNTGSNLPPMTPRFVDLRQQLFLRDYEQDG